MLARRVFFLVLLQYLHLTSQAQVLNFSGTIVDAFTKQPLELVSISIAGKNINTTSNSQGNFQLDCAATDSLTFSHLGYHSRTIAVKDINASHLLELFEELTLLDDVFVYDHFRVPGLTIMDNKKSPAIKFENSTLTTPQRGIMPVFGPGMAIRIFDGKKRKTPIGSDFEVYNALVNSPEFKENLISLFHLTEERYNQLMASFNKEYPEVSKLRDKNEIENIIKHYFASALNK